MIRSIILVPLAYATAPALAQGSAGGAAPAENSPPQKTTPSPGASIISEEEFDASIPSFNDNPLESVEEWQRGEDARDETGISAKATSPAQRDSGLDKVLADPQVVDTLLDEPLASIDQFEAEPPYQPTQPAENDGTQSVRYIVTIDGLDPSASAEIAIDADGTLYRNALRRFHELSSLGKNGGKADSRAVVSQRARADRQLLLDILTSEGYYDATVRASTQRSNTTENPPATGNPLDVVLSVVPGRRYYLGKIRFETTEVEPADLITRSFLPKSGDPIVADTILAAEANISVKLPENGYPFAAMGQRDILLDSETRLGDYVLPVDPGARSYFGEVRSEGKEAFNAKHVARLRRFKKGDLYDSRKVDDLRAALVATGLLATVSVEPELGEGTAPDGTPYADLLVRQEAGPARTLAITAGYGTGQGPRIEGSWTHRNLFPPEGSLTGSGVLATQEQSASVSFSRANAGKRDRTFEMSLLVLHSNYDAFEAYTGRVAAFYSYASTPIWQKKFTWSGGVEVLATSEDQFVAGSEVRDRQIYYVAALPGQIGIDRTDDLLNPTKGYRLNLRLSPETSLGDGSRIYARVILDGSAYYSPTDSLLLAARARVGTISGTARDNLAPSRRYYGGGGGSVRGYGYQQLGPKDINGDPIGGRSMNEAALEARYRFGNFGVAGFVDAGQVYESSIPEFDDWRFGVGIGGRFYTNFGPFRVDLATPLNRKPGESRVSVYVSIGQAF